MKKAVVLLSGGMDSCVTAAYAVKNGYEPFMLHINYGQLTQNREYKAFCDIADHYGAKNRLSVDIGYLKQIGATSLIDNSITMETGEPSKNTVPSTYVPFRNGNMISIAVSWAEAAGCSKIFIGAVEEDSSGYPDCTKVFYEKFNALLSVGLAGAKIDIETPLIDLSKKDIVKLGSDLNAPLHLTWSCYRSEDKACGVCESCFLRLRGFRDAGMIDPIPYK